MTSIQTFNSKSDISWLQDQLNDQKGSRVYWKQYIDTVHESIGILEREIAAEKSKENIDQQKVDGNTKQITARKDWIKTGQSKLKACEEEITRLEKLVRKVAAVKTPSASSPPSRPAGTTVTSSAKACSLDDTSF